MFLILIYILWCLFLFRHKMKNLWGVLRSAVLLQGSKKSKVSSAEKKCGPSATVSTRSYPYPTEFTKPEYPTKFEKPHYPTEFAKTQYPTEFMGGPNQIKTPTRTSDPLSRWDKLIDQLVLEADMKKVADQLVDENNRRKRSETRPQSVSYSPSLPAPEGPAPPSAFTYNSPAHRPQPGPENGNGSTGLVEKADSPAGNSSQEW